MSPKIPPGEPRPSRPGLRRRSATATLLAVALCSALSSMPLRAQEEVPFITTPDHVTLAMLRLAAVDAKDRIIDLGSGDGRIVITAARRFGASGLGVEIVPDLVAQSRANARKAGVADRAEFREQDLFTTDLSPFSVITMYLLQEVNLQLRPKLLALKPGTRLVSHDWDMGDWRPDRTLTLDVPNKAVGREKLSRLHLWVVPAAVEGLWCGPKGSQLRLSQRYQFVDGQAGPMRDARSVQGRVDGAQLHLVSRQGTLQARWSEGTLRVASGSGEWKGWKGLALRPSAQASCDA
jgi:SAM-dependent methyltransferase